MASGVATTVVNAAVLVVGYPVYLHFLGYEQYGVWLVLSTVLSFAQLGNLGIGQAVMKLVAEEYARDDLEAVQQYMTSAIVILVASGGAVFTVIILLKMQIVALFKLSNENAMTVSRMLPYMACLSIYVFIVQAISAMLSGFGRMDLANYAQTGGRFVAMAVAAVLLTLGTGIEGLLMGSAASYVFVHVMSLVFIRRVSPVRILGIGNLSFSRMKRLLGFGSGVLGGTMVAMLFHPINKILLSRYVGVSVITVYEIGYNGAMQIRALMEVGLRAMLPEISRMGAELTESARRQIIHINRRTFRLMLAVGAPLCATVFVLIEPLLRVWLGDGFPPELPSFFRIMLVASLMSVLAVPAHYTLMGLGYVRVSFAGYAIPVFVHFLILGLVSLLTNFFGLLCIGYTTSAGIAAGSAYLLASLRIRCAHLPRMPNEAVACIPASER
jgi:O-antigen/teichoic acid export membrane protein